MSTSLKALKKILNAGKGSLPEYKDGCKVFFDYEVLVPDCDAEDGFPTARKKWPDGYGMPMELVLGKQFQLPILEAAVQTMLVDEIAQFDIDVRELYSYPMVSKRLRDINKPKSSCNSESQHDHDHGHHCAASIASLATGYPELDRLLEKPRPLRFILHLIRFMRPDEYEAESWQLDADQRLISVTEMRLNGNKLAAQGLWQEASIKYREALGRLDTLLLREKPGDPEWLDLDNRNVSLYLNLCQCYLKLGGYYEAIETASEVLKRDPTSEKGLYRRAMAHIGAWNLDEAARDLEQLNQCHPSSSGLVQNELARIQKLRTVSRKCEQDNLRAMFHRSKS